MFKQFYFLLFFVFLSLTSKGQSNTAQGNASIKVIGKSFGDSIVLRFAPDNAMAWEIANRKGYLITKYLLLKNGKALKNPERLLQTVVPIKPLPLRDWEKLVKQNPHAAIAAQALYGKTFQVSKATSDLMSIASVVKESEMRYSFALFAADQSLEVAAASGLLFTDKNIKKGERYVYRVFTMDDKDYKIDMGYTYIGTEDVLKLPPIPKLIANFGDRTVTLSWDNRYLQDIYNSFMIERSDDQGTTFKPTSDLPFVTTFLDKKKNTDRVYKTDSLPENGKTYIFRIRGKTAFAETGPASDTVKGMGHAKFDILAPVIIKGENLNSGTIRISWSVNEKSKAQIKEYEILRSAASEGKYITLSHVTNKITSYEDTNPENNNFYKIRAISPSGESILSYPFMMQLKDSIPPSAPSHLTGIIDSSGKAVISWMKGKEPDLSSYKVYMANSTDEEYTQATKEPLKDTVFRHKVNLKTLSDKVYFKVMAFDFNYNPSQFSKVLELKRPDKIPPVPPVFDTYKAEDSLIYLHWIKSSSTDVVKHILYRRENERGSWEKVAEFKTENTASEYKDTTTKKLKNYEYSIVAIDNSSLESARNNILSLALIDRGFRPEVSNLKGTADRTKKEIYLSWEYGNDLPAKFIIYRAKKGDPLRIYKVVGGKEKSFADSNLEMDTEYVYKIKAVWGDGGESVLTNQLIMKY